MEELEGGRKNEDAIIRGNEVTEDSQQEEKEEILEVESQVTDNAEEKEDETTPTPNEKNQEDPGAEVNEDREETSEEEKTLEDNSSHFESKPVLARSGDDNNGRDEDGSDIAAMNEVSEDQQEEDDRKKAEDVSCVEDQTNSKTEQESLNMNMAEDIDQNGKEPPCEAKESSPDKEVREEHEALTKTNGRIDTSPPDVEEINVESKAAGIDSSKTELLHKAGISLGGRKSSEQVNSVMENKETSNGKEEREEEGKGEDVAVGIAPGSREEQDIKNSRRVHFSEEVVKIPSLGNASTPQSPTSTQGNTSEPTSPSLSSPTRGTLPCLPQLTVQQLLDGVVYQAQYLGSTPIIFGQNQKTVRMQQAREAVRLLKESEGETQPRIDIDLKISTKHLTIADRKTQTDLITHPLKTVSYVADIENSLVIMAHRNPPTSPGSPLKLNCHILETADPREVAMVIGQAFSTAYKEFLKSHGIKEDALEKFEYQHVLSSQSKSYLEINSLTDENQTKEISFAKHKGEILGLMVIDSGYGSAIPTCVVAHMSKGSAAAKSGLINVGDHILSVNGTSLVGMPLKVAIDQIKKCRQLTVVKMTTSSCPPVTDVTIMRPDLKFQLGFSVKDGNICSLWRGSIAERSGVRVGHQIIEINGTSVVGLTHEEIVHMLSTTVGDIHLRTMPLVMYQILTGKIVPEYH